MLSNGMPGSEQVHNPHAAACRKFLREKVVPVLGALCDL